MVPQAADRSRPRVVVLGGGFAGLQVVHALSSANVDIDLVDKRNFHLFQPLLYQVATGGLSPGNIAAPLRSIFARHANVRVLLGAATGFRPAERLVELADGSTLSYDHLVVAVGAVNHWFGNEQRWERHAPGLKTLEDAFTIRRRVLRAFETAEREPERAREWLTFVVIGAGPTGVELAGTLGEIARHTLRREFRTIDSAAARIVLVEGVDRVLPLMHEGLSAKAQRLLERLGVELRLGTLIEDIEDNGVLLDTGERIPARVVLWAAGVRASPLGKALADAAGAETDAAGRVVVQPDLALPGHPEIRVIGDLAHCADSNGKALPGVAPVAIQQGRHVARAIRRGRREPFRYRDYGMMATVGRKAAVADIRGWRTSGRFAWFLWLFVHLLQIVGYVNRALVLIQWAWNYFTFARGARLITEDD